jgi:predicted DNA-binding protein with PD1-like motif
MNPLPLRLLPNTDLRLALEQTTRERNLSAAFVVSGIGSLSVAQLRFAGAREATVVRGDLEILSLAGTLSADSAHLHMSVADASGRVVGGHVLPGCLVRTTAEILLALLHDYRFTRAHDAATGFAELVIQPLENI